MIGEAEPSTDCSGVLCLLPFDAASRLERTVSRWAAEHGIEVIVDRRHRERRRSAERRSALWPNDQHREIEPSVVERRRIRNRAGRRIEERRATLIPVASPVPLPRRLASERDRFVFAERIEPAAEHREDASTARLVTRLQAGESELFAELYERYFVRVYSYLRVALHDRHEAEDAAQQVFLQVMEALPRYELREVPFRAWLFRIVRNHTINQLEKSGRELESETIEPAVLDWLSDADLMILVGRLPLAQRQVILLRYMMDLSWTQVAEVLGRSPDAVRQLQTRALAQLRSRLAAVKPDTHTSGRQHEMARRRGPLPVLYARRHVLLAA
jgi:RNA polymerase sigma-70 factor (ECF subfamily)